LYLSVEKLATATFHKNKMSTQF